ncbi:hypothetical protein [Nocardia macrotermitis]|uniref:Uncharacterized protein n=1 Tax=Nocardia macrotermitis TaxID=2585198 RepID=A0A7K0DF21_9NOCA|nr:hypothetical protein [Nocardia macrotermitis]MQY24307.1 hypothetical protein [Nocardia macrotermitis]
MSGSGVVGEACVVDADAVARFGRLARQAGRELDGVRGAAIRIAELIGALVPHSVTVSLLCESTCTAADLVQRSADRLGGFGARAEHALTAFVEADLAHGRLLAGLEVRI